MNAIMYLLYLYTGILWSIYDLNLRHYCISIELCSLQNRDWQWINNHNSDILTIYFSRYKPNDHIEPLCFIVLYLELRCCRYCPLIDIFISIYYCIVFCVCVVYIIFLNKIILHVCYCFTSFCLHNTSYMLLIVLFKLNI